MDLEFLKDRRVVVAGGVALALLAGLGVAFTLTGHGKGKPPVSSGRLEVEMGHEEETALDPKKPLRCFVNGGFVGMETLADCAKKNGVATGSLDVGLDQTGALAAAANSGALITPLPPTSSNVTSAPAPAETPIGLPPAASKVPTTPTPAPVVAAGPTGACWRYAGTEWHRMPSDMSLPECVQALFAGRCEARGDATYGRWSDQTLRRVSGRIEQSYDNRTFHTLAQQSSGDCAIGRIGG